MCSSSPVPILVVVYFTPYTEKLGERLGLVVVHTQYKYTITERYVLSIVYYYGMQVANTSTERYIHVHMYM